MTTHPSHDRSLDDPPLLEAHAEARRYYGISVTRYEDIQLPVEWRAARGETAHVIARALHVPPGTVEEIIRRTAVA